MKLICKIAILDNYSLFSSGLKSLLANSEEMVVIAEGVSPESLTIQLQKETPDIILINMLHYNNAGIKIVKKISKFFPNIPLLLITSFDYSECFRDYIDLGAKGFVFYDDGPDSLIKSIILLCQGKMAFKESNMSANLMPENQIKISILSDREVDVLRLFCNGFTYKEIGEKLYISPRTVESHKKNILKKLHITSKMEMVKYATRNKLVSD